MPRHRVFTQIFRPDVWFVSPPVCNLLFPEEYTSFQYGREMRMETTRLQLETHSHLLEQSGQPYQQLIHDFYFAPGFTKASDAGRGGIHVGFASRTEGTDVIKSDIYDHEKFTGIVPKMERISDTAFYASVHDLDAKLQQERGATYPVGAEEDGPIRRLARQTAEFNFLRYRYAPRQGNVQAKFLPRVVPGFPALVVSRPVTAQDAEPTHFLGLIVGVTHTLSQEGGTTALNLAYMRPHLPDRYDAFLKDLRVRRSPDMELRFAPGYGDEAALQDFYTGIRTWVQFGPDPLQRVKELEQGVIPAFLAREPAENAAVRRITFLKDSLDAMLEIQKVLADFKGRSPTSDGLWTYENFRSFFSRYGGEIQRLVEDEYDLFVPRNAPAPPSTDPAALSLSVEQSFRSLLSALPLIDEIAIEAEKNSLLPLEDAIRPPWFSESYTNRQIGAKIYRPFFDCASLIDAYPPTSYSDGVAGAATKVVAAYSEMSGGGEAAPRWIYETTKRPVATDNQILHAFHKNAFGPYNDLTGLLELETDAGDDRGALPAKELPNRLIKNTNATVTDLPTRLDPRADRRRVVQSYISELQRSFGVRG